jgi:integrase
MTVTDITIVLYRRLTDKTNTYVSYRATVEPFRALFGNRECATILPAEIRAFLNDMPVSDSTRYLRYSHLKALFNSALNEERINGIKPTWENPCNVLKADFPQPKPKVRYLSDSIHTDMQTVEHSLRPQHALIFGLGTRAGLRISEILALTPDDIVQNGHCFVRLVSQKNGTQGDLAPIPADLCLSLREYAFKHEIGPSERIFPLSRQSAWEVFHVRGLKTHDMRRYAAFRALEKGKDLNWVKGMLRHSNVAVTTRYIGNLSPSKLAEGMEDM